MSRYERIVKFFLAVVVVAAVWIICEFMEVVVKCINFYYE